MSHEHRLHAAIEKIQNAPRIGANAALYLGLVALGRVRKIDETRELLPEPFDFFQHNGNILSSTTTALAASLTVRFMMNPETRLRRTKLMGAAFLGGVAVNTLVETKFGLQSPLTPEMFRDSTPDPIDFAYGMVGAGIGGAMIIASEPDKAEHSAPRDTSADAAAGLRRKDEHHVTDRPDGEYA